MNARDKLITENMNLVYMCVHRYFKNTPIDFEDLVQMGMLGLIYAADNYKPERGYAFSTYAIPSIVSTIRRELRDRGTLIRIPRKVYTAHRDITRQGLDDKDAVEIADTLGIPTAVVVDALTMDKFRLTESLDFATNERGTESNYNGYEYHEDFETGVLLHELCQHLNETEKKVLALRLRGFSQSEVGAVIGVLRASVSRIQSRIQAKYEKYLSDSKPRKARNVVEQIKCELKRGVPVHKVSRCMGIPYANVHYHYSALKRSGCL